MMLKIYGGNISAPSNKVRMTANALGLEFEYKEINIRAGENKQDWFLALNPCGKIPAIDDDGFGLFESGTICKYLCRKHSSQLYPTDLKAQAVVDQWIDFCTMHVGAAIGRLFFNRVIAANVGMPVDEQSVKDGETFFKRFLPVVDAQLGKSAYIASDKLSLADITLLAHLDPAEVSGADLGGYPNIVAWRKKLQQQDFYTKTHKSYAQAIEQWGQRLKAANAA